MTWLNGVNFAYYSIINFFDLASLSIREAWKAGGGVHPSRMGSMIAILVVSKCGHHQEGCTGDEYYELHHDFIVLPAYLSV